MEFFEEIGDFSEFGDFYDYHTQRYWLLETYQEWFRLEQTLYDLFRFAWACGYTVEVDLVPKT